MYPETDNLSISRSELHIMWREMALQLDIFTKLVREGKRVQEAKDFASWLRFSGFIPFFEKRPQAFPLLVDARLLTTKIEELIDLCAEWFKGGKVDPNYEPSDIAEIKRSLAQLTEHVSKISSPVSETTTVGSPALHVIQGGVLS